VHTVAGAQVLAKRGVGSLALKIFVIMVYAIMLSPIFFVLWLSFFDDAILYFPPSGYTFKWYWNAWDNPAFVRGFVFSLQLALISALIGVSLGVIAALGIVRHPFRGSKLVNTLLLSPLLMPGIVAGIAIYLFYLRAENYLDMDIVGTFGGLVMAHICLTIPWTVRLVSASMQGLDGSLEEAARNLDISVSVLRRWKAEAEAAQQDNGATADLKAELARLKKENHRLKLEREILKKAAAFFAKESGTGIN